MTVEEESLSVSSSSLSFPDLVGGPFERSLTIENIGVNPIAIADVSVSGVKGVTVTTDRSETTPFQLPAGEVVTLIVVFDPEPDVTYCATPGSSCEFGQIAIKLDCSHGKATSVALTAKTDNLARHLAFQV